MANDESAAARVPHPSAAPRRSAGPAGDRGRDSRRTDLSSRDDAYRPPRPVEPELPAGVDGTDLDDGVLREVNGLPAGLAERVAAHLAAAGYYLEEEPEVAHQHALFARSLASRLASVREVAGITGYLTGQFAEALSDLRTARRMTGRADMLPMMADCERGLGRPERALAMWDDPQVARLDVATRIELLIVLAGARRDLGQHDSAAVMLQVPELHRASDEPWSARLRYAYADVLLDLGRRDEALRWFSAAVAVDTEELTDARERLDEIG